jgi:hypothetical protein
MSIDETRISVLLRTQDFRGDHSAAVAKAYRVRRGETLAELVDRTLGDSRDSYRPADVDHLEIRLMVSEKDEEGSF